MLTSLSRTGWRIRLDTGRHLSRGAAAPPPLQGLPGIPILPYLLAPHNGVMIDVGDFTGDYEANSVSDFGLQLVSSIVAFKAAGKTAAWLRVPLDFGHYIPIAAHNGFTFHHAEGDGLAATLSLWLQPGVTNRIPPYATHQASTCVALA